MNLRRSFAATFAALTLVLSIAGTTLAVETNGSTPESLDIAASISMTVPTSVTYTQGKAINTTNVSVTNLATDNQTGMIVSLTVNAGGANLINPTSRSLGAVTAPSGWIGEPAKAAPFASGGSANRVDLVYTSANQPTPRTISFDSVVDASAYNPGSYTGSLNFKAATN